MGATEGHGPTLGLAAWQCLGSVSASFACSITSKAAAAFCLVACHSVPVLAPVLVGFV